jgi:hypothetical protein
MGSYHLSESIRGVIGGKYFRGNLEYVVEVFWSVYCQMRVCEVMLGTVIVILITLNKINLKSQNGQLALLSDVSSASPQLSAHQWYRQHFFVLLIKFLEEQNRQTSHL